MFEDFEIDVVVNFMILVVYVEVLEVIFVVGKYVWIEKLIGVSCEEFC